MLLVYIWQNIKPWYVASVIFTLFKNLLGFEDLMRKLRFNGTVNLRDPCIFRKTTNSVSQSLSLPFSHSGPHHSFSSVQLLSHVRLFVSPWIAARQASLSITNSRTSLKLTSIDLIVTFILPFVFQHRNGLCFFLIRKIMHVQLQKNK